MNIMKEITYKERAKFYFDETYSEIDHNFIKKIINEKKINTVLDIPCGAGRNLKLLSNMCEKVYLCDLEEQMILYVNKLIKKNEYKNCKAFNDDILTYSLLDKPELTIVLRQALQLIDPKDIEKAISNIIKNTRKYVIFDFYDFFNYGDKGMVPEYLRENVRVITYEDGQIRRTVDKRIDNDGINVKYNYFNKTNQFIVRFKLFSYSIDFIKKCILQNKVKKINDYCDYNFRTRENENSFILLVEL